MINKSRCFSRVSSWPGQTLSKKVLFNSSSLFMVFKQIKLVELSEQGSVGRNVSSCDGPRLGSSYFAFLDRSIWCLQKREQSACPLLVVGLMTKKMIILKTGLSSRHAHISSKEYFEDTYSKFSKWISNGGRIGGWFWFGTPVLRVASLVAVAVASIFSPKRRLFESIGFSRLPRNFFKYGTYLVIRTLAAMSRDNIE